MRVSAALTRGPKELVAALDTRVLRIASDATQTLGR